MSVQQKTSPTGPATLGPHILPQIWAPARSVSKRATGSSLLIRIAGNCRPVTSYALPGSPWPGGPGSRAAVCPKIIRGLGNDARPARFVAAAHAAAQYDFGQGRAIRCPVLATRGDSDVFTPPNGLVRWAHVVPHIQTVTMPRCGRFANVEGRSRYQQLLDGLRSHVETPDGERTGTSDAAVPGPGTPKRDAN